MSFSCLPLLINSSIKELFRAPTISLKSNWSFLFIYCFNFITCFVIWILIGRSVYYMNWSFVTYFFKYSQHVKSLPNIYCAENNIGVVFISWRTTVVVIVIAIINFWLFAWRTSLIFDCGVIIFFLFLL